MATRSVCYAASALLLLTNCAGGASHGNNSEPEQVFLESEEFISDSLLAKPKSIIVAEDAIAIANSATLDDSLISIFNLDGEFVRSCMPQGSGPMEMLEVSDIQYSKSGHCIYATDFQLYNYKTFSISDYLTPNVSVKDVFNFSAANNDSIMLFDGVAFLSNGQIVAGNANPAGMVAIFDVNGQPVRLSGRVPDKSLIDSRLSDFGNSTLYHPYVAVSPKGDFAVFYYDVSDMHLLINVDGDQTEVNYVEGNPASGIHASEVAPGVCVGAITEETFCYTQGVSLSDKYIYQLYIGMPRKELEETDFFKDANHYGANTVNVYDREGNHLKTITLDRWATTLAVSPDDKYLYTVTQSSQDGYTILRYKL